MSGPTFKMAWESGLCSHYTLLFCAVYPIKWMLLQNQIASLLFGYLALTKKRSCDRPTNLSWRAQSRSWCCWWEDSHCPQVEHKVRPDESWAGFSHLMRSGYRQLQKPCFILEFFLENARGFQGIYDILLCSYFQGERSLYSSHFAPTPKPY